MNTDQPLDRLVRTLSRLPGIGRRTAERMALRLVLDQKALVPDVIAALQDVKERLRCCSKCGTVTTKEEDPCKRCTDPRRENGQLCVVEDPGDIMLLEKIGNYQGRYHALMGKLSPMQGEGVENTRITNLLKRVKDEPIKEVILALNSDVESDATASFLAEALKPGGVNVTRLALGIPAGSGIAYSDPVTLERAMHGRVSL